MTWNNNGAHGAASLLLIPVLILIALFVASCNRPKPEPAPDIEITGDYVDDTHIGLLGVFTVTGYGDMDIEDLFARLEMDPYMEFSLAQGDAEGELVLRPYRPLEADKRIVIRLRGRDGEELKQWEFQTEASFKVAGTFPADGAENVPTGTGVEIILSYGDVEEETLGDYVAISPEVEGQVVKRGNMAVFIPRERNLDPMTAYKVTVSGRLARENGDALGEDVTFSFTTGGEDAYEYRFSTIDNAVENVIPGDGALLKIELGEGLREQEITATIYRYPDASGYREALRSCRDFLIDREYSYTSRRGLSDGWSLDTDGLEQVTKFTAPPVSTDSWYYWDRYVVVPETLEPGWYAARLEAPLPSGGQVEAYKLIQVSSLSVYNVQSRNMGDGQNGAPNRLVAWINDTETGGAVEGAEIAVTAANYAVRGVTGEDGVALLEGRIAPLSRDGSPREETYSSDVYGLVSVRDADTGREFHDLYGRYYFNKPNPSNDYYSYLFSDRPVYRHTDTAKIWGVVRPRREGAPLPADLRLTDSDGVESVPVKPEADGTFQVDYPFEAMRYNYAGFYLTDGDGNSYGSLHVRLEDYIKPAYQTASSTDKVIYAAWEDEAVTVDFTARYFEGTPAKGYNALVTGSGEYFYNSVNFEDAALTTDAEGNASVALRPREDEQSPQDTWKPQTIYYGIQSQDALDTVQVQGGSFAYLPRDTMLLLEADEEGKYVRAETYLVDPSRIREKDDLLRPYDETLRGAAVDCGLRAEVHRVYFKKTPSGQRYDPISKTAVTAYEYEYADEVIATLSGRTQGGAYVFDSLPREDEESGYYLVVTAADTRGLDVTEQVHYRNSTDYRAARGMHSYQFIKQKPGGEGEDDTYYSLDMMGYRFTDGEASRFYLADNKAPVEDRDGRLLFNLSQDSILDYGVVSGTAFDLAYSDAHLPNYVLSGAYFDGKQIHAVNYTSMAFNPEKRELLIEIEPGKESYDPGDTAGIAFRVTEKETGKPAADTKVLAAVVDEAVFAVEEQTPDFLNRLYQTVHFNFVHQYTSSADDGIETGGMGGGGPDAFRLRVDFPDTAAFTVLTTDGQGKAKLDAALPDSLTSWRVTALALSPEMYAGDIKGNFAVSQDFFVTPVLPPRLLEGDDLVLTVRGAGRQVSPGDTVEYSCSVEGMADSRTASGTAGSFTPITLGSLPAGEYQITVSGQWNGKKDAVTLPLQVVESGVDITVSQQLPLSQAGTLTSTTYPVTLGFYDRNYALGAEILSALGQQNGARADQRMVRRYVMERMRDSGLEDAALDAQALTDSFDDLIPDYSLYRLFPYAGDDAVLTARIMLAAPDYYRGYARFEFPELPQVEDPLQRAVGYLLLSDYPWDSDPVKIIGQELEKEVYDFRSRMYLVAAMARTGSPEKAREWYDKLAASAMDKKTDANGAVLYSVKRGGADNLEDTAAAGLAATVLGHPRAEGLARYLLATPPTDDLYILELMAYLRTLEAPETAAEVTYRLDGEDVNLDLSRGTVYRSFSRRRLAEADFRSRGEVWIDASVTADYAGAMGAGNRGLLVTKTVEPVESDSFRQGELVKITLQYQVPSGISLSDKAMMEVKDYIPTGMRYDHMEQSDGWYLSSRNDQRLTFSTTLDKTHMLVYYARCVAPGAYVNESAFVRAASGSVWGASERSAVTIG